MDDDEFVAAKSGDGIGFWIVAVNRPPRTQNKIAAFMAESVVNRFESIEVDKKDRDFSAAFFVRSIACSIRSNKAGCSASPLGRHGSPSSANFVPLCATSHFLGQVLDLD